MVDSLRSTNVLSDAAGLAHRIRRGKCACLRLCTVEVVRRYLLASRTASSMPRPASTSARPRVRRGRSANQRIAVRHQCGPYSYRRKCSTGVNAPTTPSPMRMIAVRSCAVRMSPPDALLGVARGRTLCTVTVTSASHLGRHTAAREFPWAATKRSGCPWCAVCACFDTREQLGWTSRPRGRPAADTALRGHFAVLEQSGVPPSRRRGCSPVPSRGMGTRAPTSTSTRLVGITCTEETMQCSMSDARGRAGKRGARHRATGGATLSNDDRRA